MNKVLAITDHEGLCWKCLKTHDKSDIHIIEIPQMGYASKFDGWYTEIHLCNDCYQESIKDKPDLWSMEERHVLHGEGFGEEYKYDNDMFEYICELPIQGIQFVCNEFSSGWNTNYMEPQDWIDYQLDILPHDKCNEYSLYSPEEKRAYNERFTTCEYPANRVYSDGSSGCWCTFGAHGDYGQNISLNISDKCYECKYYKQRETPIKDIKDEDFDDYELYIRMKLKQDELEKKFGK